jgi:hypothetical protein
MQVEVEAGCGAAPSQSECVVYRQFYSKPPSEWQYNSYEHIDEQSSLAADMPVLATNAAKGSRCTQQLLHHHCVLIFV